MLPMGGHVAVAGVDEGQPRIVLDGEADKAVGTSCAVAFRQAIEFAERRIATSIQPLVR